MSIKSTHIAKYIVVVFAVAVQLLAFQNCSQSKKMQSPVDLNFGSKSLSSKAADPTEDDDLMLLSIILAADDDNDLKAGIGVVDITPTESVILAGSPEARGSEGIDTRLYVRALVLSMGDKTLAIITLDTLKYPANLVLQAQQMIEEKTGIPAKNIIITASHTHSAPLWTYYSDQLVSPIAKSVVLAQQNLSSSKIAIGSGVAQGISQNRRVIKDGSAWNRWVLPAEEYNKYLEEGPADPEFKILAIFDKVGNIKAVVHNFACHATNTLSRLVSADFPGDVANYLQKKLGSQVTTFYLTGPSGDVNPIPNSSQQHFANILGEQIVQTLSKLEPINEPTLEIINRELMVTGRPNPIFAESEIALKWPSTLEMFRSSFKQTLSKSPQKHPLSITGIKIGNDFAIISSPDELFNRIGMNIKNLSPFINTMVIGQTNGAVGYIPTLNSFNNGGYETWFGEHSYLQIHTGELIEKNSLDVLQQLKKRK